MATKVKQRKAARNNNILCIYNITHQYKVDASSDNAGDRAHDGTNPTDSQQEKQE